jgi:ubiquinone/menaquinone biosynthesis C-methylase UbiE
MTAPDFTDVTEMAGEEISQEQLTRLANRYYWAADYAKGRDVIEVACGTGPGLGYLSAVAASLRSGDFSTAMVAQVKKHYGTRVHCEAFDGQDMPFQDNSADVILIFEALYYVPSAEAFVAECKRVLRPSGVVLVANANPDLFDFSPSPHSFVYHGAKGLTALFAGAGFEVDLFGSTPIAKVGLKQKILRPVKKLVVSANLMPRTMAGKRLMKRLVFGTPVEMPAEITADMVEVETPDALPSGQPSTAYKVIYCTATLPETSA